MFSIYAVERVLFTYLCIQVNHKYNTLLTHYENNLTLPSHSFSHSFSHPYQSPIPNPHSPSPHLPISPSLPPLPSSSTQRSNHQTKPDGQILPHTRRSPVLYYPNHHHSLFLLPFQSSPPAASSVCQATKLPSPPSPSKPKIPLPFRAIG
ncbi:hypothetical protein ONS96_014946 [Cadophora gregata f. sp. sojae]|nr:hypothetical protein ONS96_014946 [Cadophora gregata f. sp. sojae]